MDKRRIISLLLVITMILPILPIDQVYADNGVAVRKIEIAKEMQELQGAGEYKVLIHGNELNRAEITYKSENSAEYLPMPAQLPGSGNTLKQYAINQITHIRVDDLEFRVLEDKMPRITKITNKINGEKQDTKQFDLKGDIDNIKVSGLNFDSLGKIKEDEESIEYNTSIAISNITLNHIFENKNSPVELDRSVLQSLGTGRKNAIISRTYKQNNIDVEISYYQKNILRIFESIDINIENDVSIYPNRGKVGSPVEVTIKNKEENYSVFFKENENEPYSVGNMGKDHTYPLTTQNETIIKFKVPEGLKTGRLYKLYITNNQDENIQGKKPDFDLSNLVTKENYIGDFYVVDSETGPRIDRADPDDGSSDGSYLTIIGQRFEELRIPELSISDYKVKEEHLSIPPVEIHEPTQLRIDYESDKEIKYKGKKVDSITRDFLVTIGSDAIFEEEFLDKQLFQYGDEKDDKIYLRTNIMSPEDLEDPVKDIVILINTTITTTDDEEYVFTEFAIKEKGYTFLVSSQNPIIKEVTPNKIEVKNSETPEIENDLIISISGERFNVFKFQDGDVNKTNYPKVILGGNSESNGQITIERTPEGDIKYYHKGQEIEGIDKDGAVFEVLDSNGIVLDGTANLSEGTSIVVSIPKGISIEKQVLNSRLPVAVANPKRDTSDRRSYYSVADMISFITTEHSPTIESVNPWKVPTTGNVDVEIIGQGFLEGIKVFIHGKEVPGVKRELDRETTRGKLTFKAPKGFEGGTVLMVQNEDGGSDTHEFIYIQSENQDPRLSSILPNKGTEDDIIILRGDNFKKPDTVVSNLSGIGIDKLIGSRVEIGGVDVNSYNPNKEMRGYTAPSDARGNLIEIKDNPLIGRKEISLNSAYRDAIIKSGGKSYNIVRNRTGTLDVIGSDDSYAFILDGDKIVAIDDKNQEYQVDISKNKISLQGDSTGVSFDISYNFQLFSIREDEMGGRDLHLADYYKSIYLWDSANDKYLIVTRDRRGNVFITDGRNEEYQVKIDGDKISAGNTEVDVNSDGIKLGSRNLVFHTPYAVENNIIVGNRVEVLDTGEIEVRVPRKDLPKKYDVTVVNPDTSSATIKQGFEYLSPGERPEIHYIDPPEGSIEGGYTITIGGASFTKDTEVLIDGVKASNVKVDQTDYRSLTARVPRYRGTDEDFVSQKKFVRVHIITSGGQASTKEMFAYRLSSSAPQITLMDTTASTAGGDVIRIRGKDIRFFEPYSGNIPGPDSIPGRDYEDIDNNKKWTNILTDKQAEAMPKPLTYPTKNYDNYLSSPVLPKILIGNKQAKILEFSKIGDEYMIHVLVPEASNPGPVDVILTNNDRASSKPVKLTYQGSSPTIKTITPNSGDRSGGKKAYIEGSGYEKTKIKLIDKSGQEVEKEVYLVRFGEKDQSKLVENTNKHINIDDPVAGGKIENGMADVHLKASGFRARLKDGQVTIELQQDGEEYLGTYPITAGTIYLDFKNLTTRDGFKSYPGYELVRISHIREEGKLEVERGFSPTVIESSFGNLEATIPSYHKIGGVSVALVNRDGESNKKDFEYAKPASDPKIDFAIKDDTFIPYLSCSEVNGQNDYALILDVDYQAKNKITLIGSDFEQDAYIQLMNLDRPQRLEVDIKTNDQGQTTASFDMPELLETEVGRDLAVVLVNKDKGVAFTDDIPLFLRVTKGESNPAITNIKVKKPSTIIISGKAEGPATGKTRVTIEGSDFRITPPDGEGSASGNQANCPDGNPETKEKLEKLLANYQGQNGWEEEKNEGHIVFRLKGDTEDSRATIKSHTRTSIEVLAPSKLNLDDISDMIAQVQVKNYDGSVSIFDPNTEYKYITKPEIADINPKSIFTNDDKTVVRIEGKQFLTGAKVVVGGKILTSNEVKDDMELVGEGITGVDNDGNNIYSSVVGGIEATVVGVTEQLIEVTFPEDTDLESSSIIIINPDGGISDPYDDFDYKLPLPTKPLVLEVIPGYESTVQLVWSDSSPEVLNAADKYEVYGKLSSEKNYSFIGDTKEAEFLIKGLEVNTRYDFMVRALNRYGSALEFAEVSTRTLTLKEDDKLKDKQEELDKAADKLRKEGREEIIDGALVKTIGTEQISSSGGIYTIDFSLSQYKGQDKFIVALPVSILTTLNRNIMITDGKANFTFNPRNLYTREVIEGARANSEDAHVRVTFERVTGQEATELQTAIPRTKHRASGIYGVDFQLQVEKNITALRQMLQPGSLAINFDSRSYPNANRDKIFIGKYDVSKHEFVKTGSGNYSSTQEPARFILLSDR